MVLAPLQHSSKVAIPRLPARRVPPPTTSKSRQRDRIQRACRNCHNRKIKCSGGLPRCNYCEKTDKTCLYERTRKDRLANAKDRNQALVSVLKDLSLRVNDHDRRRIEDVLQDSDDEAASPVSISSSSRASAAYQYQKHSGMHPFAPSSSHGSIAAEASPMSEDSPLPRLDGIVLEESGDEQGGDQLNVVEAGFLGQISEVQWLQNLRSRTQAFDAVLVGPGESAALLSEPPSPMFGAPLVSDSATPRQQMSPTNYYLDHEDIKLVDCGNPFELPQEHTAALLFQCYAQTVQSSFPILPVTIEHQLHQYYTLMRNGQAIHCPQKWFALVNLVFAIGTKFSHLIQADWRADELDHILYSSRAFHLLSMNDTIVVLSTPDLLTTQAAGLFAIYYMTVGHVNRAWVMAGTAIRLAFSLGLHVQTDDESVSPAQRHSMICTWWSLHSLDSLLSSIMGRPSIMPNDEITTPLPDTCSPGRSQSAGIVSFDFLNAETHLNLLTQRIISRLYTQRKSAPSWDHLRQITVSLVGDLDKWAVSYIPQLHSQEWKLAHKQQREVFLLKLQYHRMKILSTYPSLRRIERCFEAGTDDFNSLDESVAETCVRAAQNVASLLSAESQITNVYKKGPWWTIVHNIMQALAVLMIAISCPDHFRDSLPASYRSVRQLVSSLRSMRNTNALAVRAYQIVYSIVKTSKPFVWAEVADAFPDEDITVLLQPAASKTDRKYLPWSDNDQPIETLFSYRMDGFGGYQFQML
ncbi:hypothetical protein ACET3X_002093 [Alternaria dauci]|uniref:Zn(2)-C6 fungal-type domain-containing protein n=1 Tax=Alternaria dauci TaxID=48095 RepID=A0ABR3UZ64_9PLEO